MKKTTLLTMSSLFVLTQMSLLWAMEDVELDTLKQAMGLGRDRGKSKEATQLEKEPQIISTRVDVRRVPQIFSPPLVPTLSKEEVSGLKIKATEQVDERDEIKVKAKAEARKKLGVHYRKLGSVDKI